MNVKCPKCTALIKAENMNLAALTAVCGQCHHLFRLGEGWEKEDADTSYKRVTTPPSGVEARHEYNQLVIRLDGKKLTKGWWEFWFGLVFFLFPLLFFIGILASGNKDELPWFVNIIFAFFTAAGLWISGVGLAKIINITTIRVGSFDLEVSHSPINFGKYKSRHYPIAEIKQFFVRRYSNKSQNNRPIYEYAVDFTTNNEGKTAWLIKGISEPEAAWYIESEIEEYLGLKDTTVIGEFDPSYEPQSGLSDVISLLGSVMKKRD